ncbi:FHA domain-containing protein [Luteimonas sp. Y-2-2-4F]|nr:FHA domain-containing protein [Luteimonas sp. Y-2-2-4F]MCD9030703.1 FHA domain-containing protein [Luteimonas sp. Y-2-2-4F]
MSGDRLELVFPGGDRAPAALGPGLNRVGSDPSADVVLGHAGMRPTHCTLRVGRHGVSLHVPAGSPVEVNGRPVEGLIALRPGDAIALAGLAAQLAAPGAAGPDGEAAGPRGRAPLAATMVRPALPRYVLRGMAGPVLGRSFPLAGESVVGRAIECSLRFEDAGLSRLHARLLPEADGIRVQDLGSVNGCYLNGRRVRTALARPGDELGFDRLRFRVLAPGQADAPAAPAAVPPRRSRLGLLVAVLLALAAGALAWRLL